MRSLLLVAVLFGVVGCASTPRHEPMPGDPFFAPAVPMEPVQPIVENGSIFQSAQANSLYSDVKARRVGDIITVNLRENTSATKSAGTTKSRSTDAEIDPIIGLGGNTVNIGSESIQLGLSSSNDFEGDATANQSNNLNGAISVTVIRVLPNQNLVVRGEKWLTLNNGDEYIRLTGIVRPADITPDNEILSTKIANARIQYSGTGSFASAQQEGWLARFFSSEWWPL
ncbi:flagellar basal body L-ring protein FlgH [Aestuariibacter halophilus]|uniref:Flagellar L-ring protein n=1 Tax=Fluctibacter halophilus TaxID=226011 RepID=A0ABS8G3J2_9ALTE|nr:flagellar basal body L-ring protein FlgH [Aestuariibacter halophilus]MCC2615088.1 flagellar basal body L-ring protein FlgH [Aestuariibacter halophilus]